MWKITNTTEIFKHPRITLLEDDIELPNGNTTKYLKFLNKADGVDIIAINQDAKILLVKEYNHPVGKEMWQFPGGFIDQGESPEEAARRELKEEAGLLAKELKRIGGHHIYRRRISEISHVYMASGLEDTETAREESEEGMKSEWFSEAQIEQMIADEEITASDTLAIYMIYKAKRRSR